MYKFVEKFYIYYYIIPFFLKVGGELMNKEFIFKIIDVKKNNKDESMLDILAIFDNIINKYSRKLNGEDTKQDLYVFLIKLINNIDELSIVNYEDKQVLSYFSKSLKNEYIRLSKKNDRRKNNEDYNCEDRVWGYNFIESNIEVVDSIKNLNNYEKKIIKMVVLNGYSVSEVAKKTGKSRQAISQVKNRAISKLKKVYLT
jgi:RNA polymerase sigma factor (sigma-70 family)